MKYSKVIAFVTMAASLVPCMQAQNGITSYTADQTSFMASNIGEADSEATSLRPESATAKNIYAEFLGPSNIFGISFDSRFRPKSAFGFRAGISTGIGGSLFLFEKNKNNFAIGIPLEINGIFGKGRNKFEAGIGTNLGLITRRKYTLSVDDHITDGLNDWHMRKTTSSYFYYFMFANIGYRLQKENGFMLRAGLTPTFTFGGTGHMKLFPFILPYIALGYTL
ncbi:MAG: hypothetical protein K2L59_06830 [Muribaculaceae bacterium]|nr:hypothetical protein [Muribaculaceae bacterium]